MSTDQIDLSNIDLKALDRVLEEHQILTEAIQESPIHFAVFDANDRLIAWNKAYEANYPSAFEAFSDTINDRTVTYADLLRHELSLSLPSDQVEAEVARRVEMQANACGEPVVRDYGELTLRVQKYRLPSGAVAGIALDITDLKENERQLSLARRAAERSEAAKSRFLANMSHEIRTPMNGIMGLGALLAETSLTDDQRELVTTINNAAEALLTTINDVLDFSKIDAGKLEIIEEGFDAQRLVREIADLVRPTAEQKALELRILDLFDGRHVFLGDVVRVRQCLLNLLGNAIKFTETGVVTLKAGPGPDGGLELVVRDTGIGIEPESLEKIFSAFEQVDTRKVRRFDGTGLGLAITRQLVALMGGHIEVQSEPGQGSTFTIRLPLRHLAEEADPVPTPKEPPVEASLEFSALRVLLAEDNKTNRLVVQKMLKSVVDAITIAEDGLKAVEQFRANHPDVILMDVSMPVMSGLDATCEIRKLEREAGMRPVPIIALTANAMAEDRAQCLAVGMDAFLTKPLSKDALLTALARAVAQPEDKPFGGSGS